MKRIYYVGDGATVLATLVPDEAAPLDIGNDCPACSAHTYAHVRVTFIDRVERMYRCDASSEATLIVHQFPSLSYRIVGSRLEFETNEHRLGVGVPVAQGVVA